MKTTTIEVPLSASGINKIISEIEKLKKRLDKNITRLIEAMCKDGESYAYYYYQNASNGFDYVDTYQTLASIVAYREGNKGIISVGGAAAWIEFGTGVTYNKGSDLYHPNKSELGYSEWGQYGKGNGKNKDGWWYQKEEGGKVYHTYGLPENPFMALTAQRLAAELKRNAIEVFSK